MNQKELKELIEFLIEKDIAEFELERGDVKVRIKRGATSSATLPRRTPAISRCIAAASGSPQAGSGIGDPPSAGSLRRRKPLPPEESLHIVRSPIVGTFYESPSPGSPPL